MSGSDHLSGHQFPADFTFGGTDYKPGLAHQVRDGAPEPPQLENLFDHRPDVLPEHIGLTKGTGHVSDYSYGEGWEHNQKIMQAGRDRQPLDLSNPKYGDEPRQNYTHTTGQRVLPEPSHWGRTEDYAETYRNTRKDFDNSGHEPEAQELDRYGNLYQGARLRQMGDVASRRRGESKDHRAYWRPNTFEDFGPQMSDENADLWKQHATHHEISTSAVLHTGQQSLREEGHDHIIGPMNPGSQSTVKVLMHQGTPWIVDGHHRLQEARGRGLKTVSAHILNTDNLPDHELHTRGYL